MKRKCTRCKVVWNKPKDSNCLVCPRCRTHCRRCDAPLEEDAKRYICKACASERVQLSKRKHDPTGSKYRDWRLVNTYGITVIEYEAMLKAQNGVCWICGNPPKKGGNPLHVDHLHSKGEKKRDPREKRGRVRGLLCWHCNVAIGKFGDDITKLRKAADYLEAWPAQVVLKEKSNG